MKIKTTCAALLSVLLLSAGLRAQPIDRHALVSRHDVTMTAFDSLSPLSVGNGQFAFTVDPTGLQTFPELYSATNQTPLCTQAQWGWHTIPKSDAIRNMEYRLTPYDTYGRQVGYQTSQSGPLASWMRENPHKFHMGRIALELKKADGSPAKPEDLKNLKQTLNLWTGTLVSTFELEGQPVKVETCCVGDLDAIGVRVESPLAAQQRLGVRFAFPYGSPSGGGADWNKPDAHSTTVEQGFEHQTRLLRKVDDDQYHVAISWAGDVELSQAGKHEFVLRGRDKAFSFICAFSKNPIGPNLPKPADALGISAKFWNDFWSTGGAIDLSGSTDPRWKELERRIVLSEYLTRVNCAGDLPPQETGLVYNSWYGKFHLEMHWWHVAHFALWDRQALFEKSMDYYRQILPAARRIAEQQGYKGARWPKMTDATGRDSPSGIGPLVIWQEPHPIYYAELCYRAHPDRKTLEQWQPIIDATADFMASFAVKDAKTGKYNLGPPIKTVPEHTEAKTTKNPGFEVSYWMFGLKHAQQWRERMNLPRKPEWDEVLKNMAPIPTKDGLYISQDDEDTWKDQTWEHPSLIGPLGVLPGDGVDPKIMRSTLEKVMQVWDWDRCWGWDFPMTAMSAARVGRPDLAIDALLIDSVKNKYLPSGHVYQRDDLTLYLPGNGGFLMATAMMAAGWDGAPAGVHAPGFPRDGWTVRWENLKPMP